MAIKFYDVKKREEVEVEESNVRKTTYERMTKNGQKQCRYALRASFQGRNLTKFCSKSVWDSLNVPVE